MSYTKSFAVQVADEMIGRALRVWDVLVRPLYLLGVLKGEVEL